jgi:hypothetical protein
VAPTISQLVDDGVLDADLAGMLWLLRDGGLPRVIGGRPGSGRHALAGALDEVSAAWATRDEGSSSAAAPEGEALILDADSLEEAFDRLSAPPVSRMPDQIRMLGLVVVMRAAGGSGSRLVAAHYLRPVERDAGGHLQRRPPALLAAWDADNDRHEHFAWAVTTELADRLGMALTDFERGHRLRAGLLRELVDAGRLGRDELVSAIAQHPPS